MRKILVTGGNGFLGCFLLKQLVNSNDTILATGKGPCRIPFANSNLHYESADLQSKDEIEGVLEKFQPDVIIHSGAISRPDICENNREEAWQTNVMGTENLLQGALALKSNFIFISTDFVFDGVKGMYSETDQPSPVNFYGHTKWQAEEAVKKYPFTWSIVRTVMLYGLPFHNRQNLVSACAASLSKGEKVTIYKDQVRTPTFVEDLARGIILLMDKRLSGIYHLSGKDVMSLYDMIKKVALHLNLDEDLVVPVTEKDLYQPLRRPPNTGFDISKARRELGFEPMSFEEGLEKTFAVSNLSHYH